MAFLPSNRCNARTCASRARYSDAGTTSSPAAAAVTALALIRRRQVNTWLPLMPCWWATIDMLNAGKHVSTTIRSFSSGVRRLRR